MVKGEKFIDLFDSNPITFESDDFGNSKIDFGAAFSLVVAFEMLPNTNGDEVDDAGTSMVDLFCPKLMTG